MHIFIYTQGHTNHGLLTTKRRGFCSENNFTENLQTYSLIGLLALLVFWIYRQLQVPTTLRVLPSCCPEPNLLLLIHDVLHYIKKIDSNSLLSIFWNMPAATGSSVLAGGLRLASRWGLGFWGQFGFWGFRDSGLGGGNICKSNIPRLARA